MEINNPQSFDHIIGINGEILQPKVLLATEVEGSKVKSLPMIWRKTTADEFHFPAGVISKSGTRIQVANITYGEVDPAKKSDRVLLLYDIGGDSYLFPPGIMEANAALMRVKVIEIGPWNMDIDSGKDVAHGLSFLKIRSVDVLIIGDEDFVVKKLNGVSDSAQDNMEGGVKNITSTLIQLTRQTAGIFDSGAFDHATMNRGFITIWYQN